VIKSASRGMSFGKALLHPCHTLTLRKLDIRTRSEEATRSWCVHRLAYARPRRFMTTLTSSVVVPVISATYGRRAAAEKYLLSRSNAAHGRVHAVIETPMTCTKILLYENHVFTYLYLATISTAGNQRPILIPSYTKQRGRASRRPAQ
jgi:hypothetical protein